MPASTTFKSLLQSLQQGKYAPVYFIDGEEPFYTDVITEFFEEKILAPQERDFNLSIFYGKDALWQDVVNACRRFPMFSERQVVILKDAAQMKDLGELSGYVERPSPSTIFLIEHRGKKADGRSKLVKEVDKKGVTFTAARIKDEALPDWIVQHCDAEGLQIHFQEAQLLAGMLGNDLRKIANEIDKLRLNLAADQTELTPQLIQKHIGISKEYNVFAFPEMITSDNAEQRAKMLSYFVSSPKAAPPVLMVAALYGHFEKLYARQHAQGKSQQEVAAAVGLTEKTAWKARDYLQPTRYSLAQIEECLLLLAEWSGKAVGIDSNVSDAGWLKEVTARIGQVLQPRG